MQCRVIISLVFQQLFLSSAITIYLCRDPLPGEPSVVVSGICSSSLCLYDSHNDTSSCAGFSSYMVPERGMMGDFCDILTIFTGF